jgi:amidohydrolase
MNALEDKIIEVRRNLHQEPELSNKEFRTTEKLKQWLAEADIGILPLPELKTGVVAQIGTGAEPIIAIRADIDALPIHEETGLPYSSTIPGIMHACGHDLHTAAILGAAYLLKEKESELQGTVRIIFQPAEETGHGAKQIVDTSALNDVKAIFAFHNYPELPVGHLGTRSGAITAGVDRFEIFINGVSAHAATPEKGIDSIVAASQVVLALQTLSSRVFSALDSIVVSVTRISGGNTWNVLPEQVVLEGTVRTLRSEVQKQVPEQMNRILQGLGAAAGASIELQWYPGPPATINSEDWTEFAKETAETFGYHVLELDQQMGGEDFSFFLQKIPGVYVMIGSETDYAVHHPKYTPKEELLLPAAQYFYELSTKALKKINGINE